MASFNDRLINAECKKLLRENPDRDWLATMAKRYKCSERLIADAVYRVAAEDRKKQND